MAATETTEKDEGLVYPVVRETPDGLERLKLTRYEDERYRSRSAWTTPVAFRVSVDEPWQRVEKYTPVVVAADLFDSWTKVPPPMPVTADSPGGYGVRYQRFRVTGWIEPGTWCFGGEGSNRSVQIDTTEPMNKHTVALLAMQREGRMAPGESYTRLLVNGRLWMSDTPDEYRDHVGFIVAAKGRVLIHGLGLGCALKAILHRPEVEHVDVVEISEDVLSVIGPYFAQDSRVNLIHDDALTRKWPTGSYWDAVWHDIWIDKDTNNRHTMGRLNRSFARRAGWQGAWSQEYIRWAMR